MSGEQIVSTVIMFCCCLGCGFLFLLIGVRAGRSAKPVSFWAGIEVDAERVRHIAEYNKANARMWKFYSIPYFISGILAQLGFLYSTYMYVSLIVLLLAAIPGIPILILHYKKIEKKYIDPKMLVKIDPIC